MSRRSARGERDDNQRAARSMHSTSAAQARKGRLDGGERRPAHSQRVLRTRALGERNAQTIPNASKAPVAVKKVIGGEGAHVGVGPQGRRARCKDGGEDLVTVSACHRKSSRHFPLSLDELLVRYVGPRDDGSAAPPVNAPRSRRYVRSRPRAASPAAVSKVSRETFQLGLRNQADFVVSQACSILFRTLRFC